MTRTVRAAVCACLAILLATAGGCTTASSGFERYIPSASLAQEAMERVLSAWKNDEPIEPLNAESGPITIQVADTTRLPGQ